MPNGQDRMQTQTQTQAQAQALPRQARQSQNARNVQNISNNVAQFQARYQSEFGQSIQNGKLNGNNGAASPRVAPLSVPQFLFPQLPAAGFTSNDVQRTLQSGQQRQSIKRIQQQTEQTRPIQQPPQAQQAQRPPQQQQVSGQKQNQ